MNEAQSRPPRSDSPPLTKNLAILAGVVGIFLLLVAVTGVGLRGLTAVRGYVMGEGLWSKAQKRATLELHRYARTGDDVYLSRFDEAIDVILGDRQARLELVSADPDSAAIRRGFQRGQIPEEAIEGMAWLFRTFRGTAEIQRALEIWGEADRAVDELVDLRDRLRSAVQAEGPGSPSVELTLREVDATDRHLTSLEASFTRTLHQAANRVEEILTWLLAGMALLFSLSALVGGTYVYRQLRSREAEAHRSEARYRSLFEQNVVGVAVVTRDGEILEANPAFAELFGFDDPGELCRTWAVEDLYARPEEREAVLGYLNEHGSLLTQNLQVNRRDGSTGWAIVSSVVVSDPETGEERILASAADITEQKLLEEQLVSVRRMEAMGQLAGGIAHDFNNLLTAIQANAELLAADLAEVEGEEESVDAVEEILAATRSASGLTRQLLAFSRGQAPDVEALEVNAAVAQIGRMLTRLLPESIEFRMELAPVPLAAEVSAPRLEQTVMNLAINARDAMPDGGELELTTESVTLGGHEAAHLGLEPGEYVRITMQDTGIGMEPEVRSRIFEPFFTTRADSGGHGMGLATVYGTVSRAGGTVEVSSTPGTGSTFSVYLPLSERALEEAGPPRAPQTPGHPVEGVRVLLVEDDAAVRRVSARTLERKGYEVVAAPDGETAMALLESEPAVDLILSDVVMPGLNGPRMVEKIRARYGDIPVLYMSGYLDHSLTNEELARSDTDFLGKPFDPPELLQALTELLNRTVD